MQASQDKTETVTSLLSRALQRIRATPPRIIASPPTQPRRASVVLLIRVQPGGAWPEKSERPSTLTEFFDSAWVKDPNSRPEILFLQRANHIPEDGSRPRTNAHEAHVAFPGGKMEAEDEGGKYTALRQTWEEIGIDLAEKDYLEVGQLDDREVTTSLGKRLLMILSPYVFLQTTPYAASPDPVPTTSLHWAPISSFVSPFTPPRWSTVTVDAASRLAPKHSNALRLIVRLLVGSMQFPAIIIPTSPSSTDNKSAEGEEQEQILKLWGLSLGMTLDLMSYMVFTTKRRERSSSNLLPVMQLPYHSNIQMEVVAPSLASVFPSFSYPDVNFWIWLFGKRYREVVRGWEQSLRTGGINDRRINWTGSALSTFYAAVRKALVVVIVARALGILFGLGFTAWWIFL